MPVLALAPDAALQRPVLAIARQRDRPPSLQRVAVALVPPLSVVDKSASLHRRIFDTKDHTSIDGPIRNRQNRSHRFPIGKR